MCGLWEPMYENNAFVFNYHTIVVYFMAGAFLMVAEGSVQVMVAGHHVVGVGSWYYGSGPTIKNNSPASS